MNCGLPYPANESAARWFWEFDGTRNPSLTWDQATNRHEVLIPPPLGELD